MEQNRVSKYLLYALGEIILVVIGILIALQINNWNEERKNSIEEKTVLNSLHENFLIAKKQSKDLIANEETLRNRLIQILDISSKSENESEEKLSDVIFRKAVWDVESDQPTFNTYNNLKNTNKLALISNKTIAEEFTELEFTAKKLSDID